MSTKMNKKQSIYLDYQASTPPCEKAIDAINAVEREVFANPHSSDHSAGWKAAEIIDNALENISKFINSFKEEVIVTSGATEANNLAIIGSGITAHEGNRKKIIVSPIEHKCVLGACDFLKKHFSYEIIKTKVQPDGIIDLNYLESILSDEVLLVSIMAVSNEIGSNQPTKEIGELCKAHGIIFHVDAAQALYKNLDVVEDGIDLLSLSGHKVYGPKGIGALFINQLSPVKPTPLFQGGGQQNGYRSGTIPTPLVAGFAAAIEELSGIRKEEVKKLQHLNNAMWQYIKNEIPDIQLNGSKEERHPGNLNIFLPNINAKALIGSLQPSISISTGSACTSGIPEPSHVLRAIGLNTHDAECCIRISIGRYTKQNDIELAAAKIIDAAKSYQREFSLASVDAS